VISGVPALPEDLWESMRRGPLQTSSGVNRVGINLLSSNPNLEECQKEKQT
jgi:hypothetical protein